MLFLEEIRIIKSEGIRWSTFPLLSESYLTYQSHND